MRKNVKALTSCSGLAVCKPFLFRAMKSYAYKTVLWSFVKMGRHKITPMIPQSLSRFSILVLPPGVITPPDSHVPKITENLRLPSFQVGIEPGARLKLPSTVSHEQSCCNPATIP